jgi:electron transport complex protein RnfD
MKDLSLREESLNGAKFIVSTSPHISTSYGIQKIMLNVLIALIPAAATAVYVFGLRAFVIMALSVLSAVLFEHLWCLIIKKETTIGDLSACITGLLLAMTIPVSVPLFIPVAGSFFAIVVAKCLFGGLGNNFINPALAGRAFLLASYSVPLTTWTKPLSTPRVFGFGIPLDAITAATPLNIFKTTGEISANYLDLFFGNIGGSLGEVSALAILLGFIYLLLKKIIKPYITLSFILTVGIAGFIFGGNGLFTGDFLFSILSGGVILGGVFMLTDYTTSPATKWGNVTAGIIAGLVTAFIRVKGGLPEGVCYSILFVNILAPQLDKLFVPKKFGA